MLLSFFSLQITPDKAEIVLLKFIGAQTKAKVPEKRLRDIAKKLGRNSKGLGKKELIPVIGRELYFSKYVIKKDYDLPLAYDNLSVDKTL